MTKTKFYYFNIRALGESCRLLLTYTGEEFEDHRVGMEEWKELKPKTVFGQLPILEMDGKQYAQSNAICRYLGRKHGLAGDTIEEDLIIDQNVDFLNDIRIKAAAVHYENDETVKAKKHEDFAKNVYPAMLNKLDEIIKQNNGHLALGKLTWGDFVFAGIFLYLKTMLQMPDLEEKYPSFKKLYDTVFSFPKIQDYVSKLPTPVYNF
ncbi:glutathione S-transferase 2 isoform X1 [Papilio machaon]|uniref:glutathione S-transferase 2 isoform X1 n=1 Tax=Papilio machaon TaxID=76193 RepID=UPI001E66441E|nr:glutathione S-transferase 2 isoform X1 [Papilio machaon]